MMHSPLRIISIAILLSALAGNISFADEAEKQALSRILNEEGISNHEKSSLHVLRALEFEKQKAIDKAIVEYEEALKLDPENADACSNLATLYVDSDQLDKAEKLFKKAIRLKPNTASYHVNLANLFYFRQQYGSAISEYRIALELDPNFSVAHSNLGDAYLKKSLFNLAFRHFQKALELKPDFAVAHSNLGGYYYAVGDKVKARQSILRALELDPQLSAAYENLGRLEIEEHPENALVHFRKALDFATSVYDAEQAKTGITKAESLLKISKV